MLHAQCRQVDVNQHLHNANYYLAPTQSLSRKQIKTKQMLCKPLFIIIGRVKGFLKVILQYKNEAPPLKKWRGTYIILGCLF